MDCGGRYAASCDQCPGEYGEIWCGGQCHWDSTSNVCVDKPICNFFDKVTINRLKESSVT